MKKFENLYPKYNCPKCGGWFHLPWKDCDCTKPKKKSRSFIVDIVLLISGLIMLGLSVKTYSDVQHSIDNFNRYKIELNQSIDTIQIPYRYED